MRMVKRGVFLALAVLLVLTLSSFGRSGRTAEGTELIVFAAASMQETLEEIGADYTARHQDVSIVFNFDSSGTLKTQIQEGADCDIFISAGQKQMDQLDAAANTEGLDFVLAGSRVDLLENKVALAVPDGNPGGITGYGDLKSALEAGTVLMAMGNSDVPVGQYTQKILNGFGLDEEALAASEAVTYGSNAKEVTIQIAEGIVDCGVIYATDACSAGLTVVDTATEAMCGRVIYPAAILKGSRHREAAEDFFRYLRSAEAGRVLERVGFTPLG